MSLTQILFDAHHTHVHLPRVERVIQALSDHVGAAASLLDVGAGDGTIARGVAARTGADRVAGVDIKVRPGAAIDVRPYDGRTLPFEDGAFEAVLISDVLHHCDDPIRVLAECLRVASRVVAVKDHFRFGPVSNQILLWMDVVGNAAPAVEVKGTYYSPGEWAAIVADAGGRFAGLTWPLRIHDLPFRVITRDEYQFAAAVTHAPKGQG